MAPFKIRTLLRHPKVKLKTFCDLILDRCLVGVDLKRIHQSWTTLRSQVANAPYDMRIAYSTDFKRVHQTRTGQIPGHQEILMASNFEVFFSST